MGRYGKGCGVLGGVFGIMAASTALAADVWEGHHSGFLGDDSVYAKLQDIEIKGTAKGKRWVGPKLNFANYKSIIVDDVVLYPEPEPTAQVSAETLKKISEFSTMKLREKVARVLNVVKEPGPDVVRLEAALTGVAIEVEGMQVYEVLPVAAAFGVLRAATGTRNMEVYVFFEGRFVDSTTGELLGAGMRRVEGEKLSGDSDALDLEDMEESLDTVTDDLPGLIERHWK